MVSGSLLNYGRLSRDLGIPATTLRSHVDLLETLFLVRRIPAWHTSRLSRIVKAPKIYITDTGLRAHLASIGPKSLQADDAMIGRLLETFVVMELVRQADWQASPPRIHHYRDKDGHEVDTIIEHRDGSVIAIEAKTAASVGPSDFRGLARVRDALGAKFKAGAVLYTGAATLPFGNRLAAVPLEGLWRHHD